MMEGLRAYIWIYLPIRLIWYFTICRSTNCFYLLHCLYCSLPGL